MTLLVVTYLVQQRAEKSTDKLVGLVLEEKGVLRSGSKVIVDGGKVLLHLVLSHQHLVLVLPLHVYHVQRATRLK